METPVIITDHNLKQLKKHGTKDYPILILAKTTLPLNTKIIPWHWHNDFELIYLESGHFEFFIGNDTFILNRGEAVFINSKVIHQIKSVNNETTIYYCYTFSPELISESMQSLIACKYIIPLMNNYNYPYYIFHNNIPWEKDCLTNIHELNKAASSKNMLREFKVKHYLQSVFISMIENISYICDKTDTNVVNENYEAMKIIIYIQEHYSESISLSDLTHAANISKSSCNRLFRKILKTTPFQYILDFRINESMQLLNNSTKSISEIAFSCGFNDVSYYCKVFRKCNGISPQKYRYINKI